MNVKDRFSFLVQEPNAGEGRLVLEVSRSHTVDQASLYE